MDKKTIKEWLFYLKINSLQSICLMRTNSDVLYTLYDDGVFVTTYWGLYISRWYIEDIDENALFYKVKG